MNLKILITIVLLLFPLKHVQSQNVLDPAIAEKIDSILRDKQKSLPLPGVAFAIVDHDRVVYMKAFGLRDVEARLPMTIDTVVPIGSCTKAFTSFAIGIAQQQGKLSFNDPPRKFLPWFHMADPEADSGVTIRDMLSHRTGLRANADLAAEPGILTREEYVRAAISAKPEIKFRSGFQYSNAMFSAAGLILGTIYGTSWEHVIRDQIFEPLQMKSGFTSLNDALKTANHANGYVYHKQKESWERVAPPRSMEALAPAGAIASSARDLTNWLRVLTKKGEFNRKRLISQSIFHELTTGINPINNSLTYALGWATYDWNGHIVVEHNGGSDGISALVSFIPKKEIGFVFLSNTSPNFMTIIGNAGNLIWPLLLGEKAPESKAQKKPSDSVESSAVQTNAKLPEPDQLLKMMIEAAGGERNLQRHTSLRIDASKSYENQGIKADFVIHAAAPAKREEYEKWFAAGREIGTVRIYFDGVHGGQETTFGQDSINDAAANELAIRESTFPFLLHLADLYQQITIAGKSKVEDQDCYVLQLTPNENPTRLYVSVKNLLVLKKELQGQSFSYRDFRNVDGEKIPFETVMKDPLGETVVKIKSARFNGAIPPSAFEAQK